MYIERSSNDYWKFNKNLQQPYRDEKLLLHNKNKAFFNARNLQPHMINNLLPYMPMKPLQRNKACPNSHKNEA